MEERKREEKEENLEKKEKQVSLRNLVAVRLNFLEVREEHEKAADADADEPFVKDDRYDIYYIIYYININYMNIKTILTLLLCFIIHAIAISIAGFMLLFCNDILVLSYITFIVLLVFIQTMIFGCIVNILEGNATMEFLINIAKKTLNIKCTKQSLLDDLPKILVGMCLMAYIVKLTILVILSYKEIKLLEAAMTSFIFFKFTESFTKLKYVYNQVIRY